MVVKKYWEKPINEFIDLVRQEKENKFIKILDASFEIYPEVFSPIYSSDTAWFAQKIISLVPNKKFLEVGTGAGVIACMAAIYGAINVVATDINPQAIKNVLANAKLHSLLIEAREGNVFDPILKNELFDVIFWNHPFYCLEEKANNKDMLSLSVYDTEYRSLKEFFLHGKTRLERGGQLLLGTSNVARISLIKKIAHDTGYNIRLLEKTEVPVYRDKKVKMDIRLYAFNPL